MNYRASIELIETQLIDNPHTGLSQYLHEIETKGYRAGKIEARINLVHLYGGFARFKGTQAQNKTAARFKSLYERAQLGGSKAIDPSVEAVDGGKSNPEAIYEIGADARTKLRASRDYVGKDDFTRLEYVIIGENGPTAYAKRLLGVKKPNHRHVSKALFEIRRILDTLSVHYGYATC